MAKLDAEMRSEIEALIDERVRTHHVTREDFSELKSIVADLAKSQRRLAVAQRRTATRIKELAEAQKRTETRVEELAEAQKRTETRVEELAEAQKRTEGELQSLVKIVGEIQKDVRDIRSELGGIAHAVGYGLEDKAIAALPTLLAGEHGIQVEGRLVRDFVDPGDGNLIEVNILGRGRKNGRTVLIVGEAKVRPSKRDVSDLVETAATIRQVLGGDEVVLILVAYVVFPLVKEAALAEGILVYPSWRF